jgi:hypothetical protein
MEARNAMINDPRTARIFFENEAAEFLTSELKIPCKTSTLRYKRSQGGGPVYRRVLGRVEYDEGALRDWAASMRAVSYSHTAEEPENIRLKLAKAEAKAAVKAA